MKICKKCIQPDTRPGIQFDSDGICPACRFAEQSKSIDWDGRKKELVELVEFGKKNSKSGYDCIIGVSGGKDSTRQAIYLRDELDVKPLLVNCSYPPQQLTERGAHNISNLISLGFDCITVGPDPQTWKKMFREGFLKYGNPFKSSETVLYSSLPKTAIAYHIPLVCLGENPAIALGALEVRSVTGDANKMKHSFTLQGGPEAVMTKNMVEQDVYWYRYPSDEEMAWANLKLFYLGYYIPDFSRFRNAQISVKHGLKIRIDKPENTGDPYGFEALDDDFSLVNQMLKYLKYGFGKATDQLSEAIRLEIMTREHAIEIAKKYDGLCSEKYIKRFCEYIEISTDEFWQVADSFRNLELWEYNGGSWSKKWEIS